MINAFEELKILYYYKRRNLRFGGDVCVGVGLLCVIIIDRHGLPAANPSAAFHEVPSNVLVSGTPAPLSA